ncbi:MAG: ribonuclease P protein component [Verrucomicrobia bacterium]|nr:ribonuclease P protein component [Verrucomicrobiota bacterium]
MTAARPVPLRLTQGMRLRTKREFNLIRDTGHRLARGCLAANWKILEPGSTCRIGLITSRKLGKAVIRTRARRLLRETFRLHQHDFREPVAIVLIARRSIIGKTFRDVENDFVSLCRQANLLKRD